LPGAEDDDDDEDDKEKARNFSLLKITCKDRVEWEGDDEEGYEEIGRETFINTSFLQELSNDHAE